MPEVPTTVELAALRRLIDLGKGESAASRRVADFLLAWWNAGGCGGFDLTNLWSIDRAVANDMQTVIGLIVKVRGYPTEIDETFGAEFEAIVRTWRPELLS